MQKTGGRERRKKKRMERWNEWKGNKKKERYIGLESCRHEHSLVTIARFYMNVHYNDG